MGNRENRGYYGSRLTTWLRWRRLVTINFVLAELHALLLTRPDRRLVARVLAEVGASGLPAICPFMSIISYTILCRKEVNG